MKYRVVQFTCSKFHPCTYFKTKKEAVAFQGVHGGEVQRKIGGHWFSY